MVGLRVVLRSRPSRAGAPAATGVLVPAPPLFGAGAGGSGRDPVATVGEATAAAVRRFARP